MTIQRKSEIRVGLLFILGLVSFFYIYKNIEEGVLAEPYKEYTLEFDFVGDLYVGSKVRYSGGISCGYIKNLTAVKNKAWVTIMVQNDIEIYERTEFSIRTAGLLGEKYIYIQPPQSEDPGINILPGGQPILAKSPFSLDALFEGAEELVENVSDVVALTTDALKASSKDGVDVISNVNGLITDVREAIKGNNPIVGPVVEKIHLLTDNLNVLITHSNAIVGQAETVIQGIDTQRLTQTINRLSTFVHNIEQVLLVLGTNVNQVVKHSDTALQTLTVSAVDLIGELKTSITGVKKDISRLAKTGEKQFVKLFEGPDGLNATLGETKNQILRISDKTLELFSDLQNLKTKIDPITSNLNQTIVQLNKILASNQSILGKLMNLDEMGDTFQNIVKNLDSMVEQVRKSPLFTSKSPPPQR